MKDACEVKFDMEWGSVIKDINDASKENLALKIELLYQKEREIKEKILEVVSKGNLDVISDDYLINCEIVKKIIEEIKTIIAEQEIFATVSVQDSIFFQNFHALSDEQIASKRDEFLFKGEKNAWDQLCDGYLEIVSLNEKLLANKEKLGDSLPLDEGPVTGIIMQQMQQTMEKFLGPVRVAALNAKVTNPTKEQSYNPNHVELSKAAERYGFVFCTERPPAGVGGDCLYQSVISAIYSLDENTRRNIGAKCDLTFERKDDKTIVKSLREKVAEHVEKNWELFKGKAREREEYYIEKNWEAVRDEIVKEKPNIAIDLNKSWKALSKVSKETVEKYVGESTRWQQKFDAQEKEKVLADIKTPGIWTVTAGDISVKALQECLGIDIVRINDVDGFKFFLIDDVANIELDKNKNVKDIKHAVFLDNAGNFKVVKNSKIVKANGDAGKKTVSTEERVNIQQVEAGERKEISSEKAIVLGKKLLDWISSIKYEVHLADDPIAMIFIGNINLCHYVPLSRNKRDASIPGYDVVEQVVSALTDKEALKAAKQRFANEVESEYAKCKDVSACIKVVGQAYKGVEQISGFGLGERDEYLILLGAERNRLNGILEACNGRLNDIKRNAQFIFGNITLRALLSAEMARHTIYSRFAKVKWWNNAGRASRNKHESIQELSDERAISEILGTGESYIEILNKAIISAGGLEDDRNGEIIKSFFEELSKNNSSTQEEMTFDILTSLNDKLEKASLETAERAAKEKAAVDIRAELGKTVELAALNTLYDRVNVMKDDGFVDGERAKLLGEVEGKRKPLRDAKAKADKETAERAAKEKLAQGFETNIKDAKTIADLDQVRVDIEGKAKEDFIDNKQAELLQGVEDKRKELQAGLDKAKADKETAERAAKEKAAVDIRAELGKTVELAALNTLYDRVNVMKDDGFVDGERAKLLGEVEGKRKPLRDAKAKADKETAERAAKEKLAQGFETNIKDAKTIADLDQVRVDIEGKAKEDFIDNKQAELLQGVEDKRKELQAGLDKAKADKETAERAAKEKAAVDIRAELGKTVELAALNTLYDRVNVMKDDGFVDGERAKLLGEVEGKRKPLRDAKAKADKETAERAAKEKLAQGFETNIKDAKTIADLDQVRVDIEGKAKEDFIDNKQAELLQGVEDKRKELQAGLDKAKADKETAERAAKEKAAVDIRAELGKTVELAALNTLYDRVNVMKDDGFVDGERAKLLGEVEGKRKPLRDAKAKADKETAERAAKEKLAQGFETNIKDAKTIADLDQVRVDIEGKAKEDFIDNKQAELLQGVEDKRKELQAGLDKAKADKETAERAAKEKAAVDIRAELGKTVELAALNTLYDRVNVMKDDGFVDGERAKLLGEVEGKRKPLRDAKAKADKETAERAAKEKLAQGFETNIKDAKTIADLDQVRVDIEGKAKEDFIDNKQAELLQGVEDKRKELQAGLDKAKADKETAERAAKEKAAVDIRAELGKTVELAALNTLYDRVNVMKDDGFVDGERAKLLGEVEGKRKPLRDAKAKADKETAERAAKEKLAQGFETNIKDAKTIADLDQVRVDIEGKAKEDFIDNKQAELLQGVEDKRKELQAGLDKAKADKETAERAAKEKAAVDIRAELGKTVELAALNTLYDRVNVMKDDGFVDGERAKLLGEVEGKRKPLRDAKAKADKETAERAAKEKLAQGFETNIKDAKTIADLDQVRVDIEGKAKEDFIDNKQAELLQGVEDKRKELQAGLDKAKADKETAERAAKEKAAVDIRAELGKTVELAALNTLYDRVNVMKDDGFVDGERAKLLGEVEGKRKPLRDAKAKADKETAERAAKEKLAQGFETNIKDAKTIADLDQVRVDIEGKAKEDFIDNKQAELLQGVEDKRKELQAGLDKAKADKETAERAAKEKAAVDIRAELGKTVELAALNTLYDRVNVMKDDGFVDGERAKLLGEVEGKRKPLRDAKAKAKGKPAVPPVVAKPAPAKPPAATPPKPAAVPPAVAKPAPAKPAAVPPAVVKAPAKPAATPPKPAAVPPVVAKAPAKPAAVPPAAAKAPAKPAAVPPVVAKAPAKPAAVPPVVAKAPAKPAAVPQFTEQQLNDQANKLYNNLKSGKGLKGKPKSVQIAALTEAKSGGKKAITCQYDTLLNDKIESRKKKKQTAEKFVLAGRKLNSKQKPYLSKDEYSNAKKKYLSSL